MTPKPFFLSVKAVIRDAFNRILLLKRSQLSKNNAGSWEFPGGKADPAESLDRAVLREVKEETGLDIELGRVLGAAESELADRRVAYLFLESSHRGGAVVLSAEHDAFEWAHLDQLLHRELAPQFREFVASCVALEKSVTKGRI